MTLALFWQSDWIDFKNLWKQKEKMPYSLTTIYVYTYKNQVTKTF